MNADLHIELPAAAANEVRENFLIANGCKLRYLSAGSGPPVLLIHGLLGYSFSWRFTIPALASCFSVYALDLPGVGLSEKVRNREAGLAALTQDVLGFLKQLAINDVILIGSSHGGGIAMMAASRAQGAGIRIRKLVLVSPVNPWSRQGAGRAAFFGNWMGGTLLSCFSALAPLTHSYFLRRMYGDPRRLTAETIAGYDRALRLPGTLQQLLARVRDWNNDLEEIRAALQATADIPTLLMWGSEDRAVPLASATALNKALNKAALAVIPGAGHLPYEEMPEEFNRLVLQFLLAEG